MLREKQVSRRDGYLRRLLVSYDGSTRSNLNRVKLIDEMHNLIMESTHA